MCTIALPTIKDDLGFDEGSLQWVLTAYALTVSQFFYLQEQRDRAYAKSQFGGFLMVGGRLGEMFGQVMAFHI